MKATAAAVVLGFVILALPGVAAPRGGGPCPSGEAKAFISIRANPPHLVGTIPNAWVDNPGYFTRRYNCRGGSAQVKRIDLGIYEVRFPGIRPGLVLATAVSQEAVTVSAFPIEQGIVRVALRGPLFASDVATRRDVPFSIVVF